MFPIEPLIGGLIQEEMSKCEVNHPIEPLIGGLIRDGSVIQGTNQIPLLNPL